METMQSTIGRALTGMREQQTRNALVNTTAWAKWFEFSIEGNPQERQQREAMVVAAASFIKAVKAGAEPYWLTFLGTSGAGKTYLAKKIWNWFKTSEHFKPDVDGRGNIAYPGQWCFWPRLAGELLGNEGYGRLDDLQSEKFIVIDEVGSDRDPSGHVRDCLARLLCERARRWTIITSNKSLGEVQRDIDTRISSRMIRDGSVVVDVDLLDFSNQ